MLRHKDSLMLAQCVQRSASLCQLMLIIAALVPKQSGKLSVGGGTWLEQGVDVNRLRIIKQREAQIGCGETASLSTLDDVDHRAEHRPLPLHVRHALHV